MNIEEFFKYVDGRVGFIDLDDTLIPTHYLYTNSLYLLQGYLLHKVGKEPIIHLHDFLEKELEIDRENRKKFGYSLERFPTSLVQTFEYFCNRVRVPCTEKDRRVVYKIGQMAFKFTPELCEGAEELLTLLKKRGDTLYLWTAGPYDFQMDKVEKNNLGRFFDKLFIVEEKTKEGLEKMIKNNYLDRSKIYVVGDDYTNTNEIKLARDSGFFAVQFHADGKESDRILYPHDAKGFLAYLKSP